MIRMSEPFKQPSGSGEFARSPVVVPGAAVEHLRRPTSRANMRIVAANRHELPVSIAVVVAAVLFQVVPIGIVGALILGGAMVVGLLCAVNTILDKDEMGVIETYVASLWLIVMLIMTPLTIYWVGTLPTVCRQVSEAVTRATSYFGGMGSKLNLSRKTTLPQRLE